MIQSVNYRYSLNTIFLTKPLASENRTVPQKRNFSQFRLSVPRIQNSHPDIFLAVTKRFERGILEVRHSTPE